MLKKQKPNGKIEFTVVYFNSTTKTVINHKFILDKSSQEILYRIGNWINEESGWIVELTESQYIKISSYRLLSRSSYVQLPVELRSSKKGLINITNNDQKWFLLCHVRHVNPVKIHPERITREDKELVNNLDNDGVGFPMQEKDFTKIKTKNNTWINVYCYENKLTFPVSISDQKFKKPRNLLLVIDENKSHYVHIKTLTDLFIKQRIKTRKMVLQELSTMFL